MRLLPADYAQRNATAHIRRCHACDYDDISPQHTMSFNGVTMPDAIPFLFCRYSTMPARRKKENEAPRANSYSPTRTADSNAQRLMMW